MVSGREAKIPKCPAPKENMSIPRTSIRSFLIHAKSALKTAVERKQKVTLVIGNESCGQSLPFFQPQST